jgi:hypothetical protein
MQMKNAASRSTKKAAVKKKARSPLGDRQCGQTNARQSRADEKCRKP